MNQKQTNQNQLEKKSQALIEFEKTLSDSVQNRINELSSKGRLNLPANYSVGNALQSAWLKILATKDMSQRPALEVCTKESVANALLDMAIMGLNPSKQQGYFIVYGNQLAWFTSYFGNCAAVQRLSGCESEPVATLIYANDELTIEHTELGEEIVTNHKTTWENKTKGEIVGAYATVKYKGKIRSALMTMQEIKESWSMSKSNKEHKMFTGEFAKRTVLNRLTKMIIKTTSDDDLLGETLIENESKHYDFESSDVKKEIELNANSGEIVDVSTIEIVQATPKETKSESQPKQEELNLGSEPVNSGRPF